MTEVERKFRAWIRQTIAGALSHQLVDASLDYITAAARAEGYAEAKEQAARMMETWPHLSDGLRAEYEDANTRVARRIRAMTPEEP